MLSTQIIGFLVLTVYPICWAAKFSWFYYDGAICNTRFVGWENFIKIFTEDAMYWKTWLTTLQFALVKLPIELPLAMYLAVLLNKKLKGKGFFRAVFYLPNIISIAIVGLIFSNIFDYFGVINSLLVKFHIVKQEVDWFINKGTAMAVLVCGSIWCSFGINILYFLAALKNVPEELYDCAYLDGASKRTIFFKITLPMMAPVMQTIILLSVNGTLQINEYILVMTNGAPGGKTFTVMSYLVSKFVPGFAQTSVNIGYGCALSLVTSALMALIAFAYMKLSKKLSEIY